MAGKTYKRELSDREISACENATTPVCKCRCGGALHGAKRVKAEDGIAGFCELPADDPHHILTEAEKREARNAAARAKTAEKQRRIADYYERKSREDAELYAKMRESGGLARAAARQSSCYCTLGVCR